jgi:hypothetical protein
VPFCSLSAASFSIAPAADVISLSRPLFGPDEAHVPNEFVDGIVAAAKENKIFVNVGIHEYTFRGVESNKRVFNTNLLISESGNKDVIYRKACSSLTIL